MPPRVTCRESQPVMQELRAEVMTRMLRLNYFLLSGQLTHWVTSSMSPIDDSVSSMGDNICHCDHSWGCSSPPSKHILVECLCVYTLFFLCILLTICCAADASFVQACSLQTCCPFLDCIFSCLMLQKRDFMDETGKKPHTASRKH
jgi:hypothetical protein